MAAIRTGMETRDFTCRTVKLRMMPLLIILLLLDITKAYAAYLYFDDNDVDILVKTIKEVTLIQVGQFNTTLNMTALVEHADIVEVIPAVMEILGSEDTHDRSKTYHHLKLRGINLGNSEIAFEFTPPGFVSNTAVFLRIAVMHSSTLKIVSTVMGWIYFAAWSVSFYPQIYINYMRKSVIGLNFDFLALNIVGFSLYSVFNCGMYFIKSIQVEYFTRHPRGINPVFLNDVFFSLHAAFATTITIIQCLIYVRGNQRVSSGTRGILCAFAGVIIASIGLAISGRICWLDCIYNLSYIKLCTTLIKYMPQAYMNYKRKSTVGWSIGNILLDFVGGSLSTLQKVVNGYNYNDWSSFFGNFTKLGIGVFSLSFDIFFMIQHYILYRDRSDHYAPHARTSLTKSSKPPPPPDPPEPVYKPKPRVSRDTVTTPTDFGNEPWTPRWPGVSRTLPSLPSASHASFSSQHPPV